MNPQKNQGTAWESEAVKRAQDRGYIARRIAEGGSKDKGDVFIQGYGSEGTLVAVLWKRLVNSGGRRRKPDGEKEVVILSYDDFLDLLMGGPMPDVVLECKATQTLNVTRVLGKARRKALQ